MNPCDQLKENMHNLAARIVSASGSLIAELGPHIFETNNTTTYNNRKPCVYFLE